MKKNKTALIGHSGFLGNELKKLLRFDYLFDQKNINLYDNNLVNTFPKDISTVVFLAGNPRLFYYHDKPGECLRTNYELVQNILQIPFKQFIFASSVAVYKDTGKISDYSKVGWNEQMHFYGLAKILAEKEILLNRNNSCILRLSTLYSHESTKGPLFDIVKKGESWVDLESKYSFLHITDAAQAILHCIKKNLTGIYNVTDNKSHKLSDLFSKIEKIKRLGATKYNYASDNKKLVATGWKTENNVQQFINKLINENDI